MQGLSVIEELIEMDLNFGQMIRRLATISPVSSPLHAERLGQLAQHQKVNGQPPLGSCCVGYSWLVKDFSSTVCVCEFTCRLKGQQEPGD